MDINGINGINTFQASQSAGSPAVKDATNLNYDSFRKLFVESLKNQDPMAPMEQSEMMGQLTQLSQMENNMKLVSIVESMGNQLNGSKLFQYAAFIGKNVTVATDEGKVEGVVKSISNENGTIKATLEDGHVYEIERINVISD